MIAPLTEATKNLRHTPHYGTVTDQVWPATYTVTNSTSTTAANVLAGADYRATASDDLAFAESTIALASEVLEPH